MMNFEQSRQHAADSELYNFEDEIYFPLLRKLPTELAVMHANKILDNDMSDDDALVYLEKLLEKRNEANTESHISDTLIDTLPDYAKESILKHIETDVYRETGNQVGIGTTAVIKSMLVQTEDGNIPMAVKYLETPTEKTLSASAEHDMLIEAERIKAIEELEKDQQLNYLSVPHPYLHHKNSDIECYAMQLIDGYDLSMVFEHPESVDAETLQRIVEIDEEAVGIEIDRFFSKMHEYCLHGDIKPRNLMFDVENKIYLIDFGQSVLTNGITEEQLDQFENLKEDEIRSTKEIIKISKKKAAARLAEISS